MDITNTNAEAVIERNRIINEGWSTINGNAEKIAAIKEERSTKLNKLAIYLLEGKPVSGRTMIENFHILSYRDAIYDLKKKGYEFKSRTLTHDGIQHEVWWLSMFTEEFMRQRDCTIW